MRRTEGFLRWIAVGPTTSWAKIRLMFDRDDPRFPSFWQIQALGWAGLYALVMVSALPYLRTGGVVRNTTLSMVFMFLASCLLRPACRSLVRRPLSWMALEIRGLGWSLVMGMVTCFVFYELVIWKFRKLDLGQWAEDSVQFSVVLFLWCSLYFSIKQWQQLTQERERLLRAETESREARLNALRYQLNPHFLFNSLNAVSTLVLDGNAPAATTMLAQIGELLRTSLDNEAKLEVALSQEIAFTERYLAIEQTRLGERLRVHLAISSETLDALVPSMLLQPLVENAVRHGVAQFIDGGAIGIESELIVDRLRIVIRNSGRRGSRKLNASGNGIGLSNTEERLKTLYGTDHKFSLGWPETGGCEVTVELPFRKVGQPQEALVCAH
jgi:two-component system LytT family sensor kinase